MYESRYKDNAHNYVPLLLLNSEEIRQKIADWYAKVPGFYTMTKIREGEIDAMYCQVPFPTGVELDLVESTLSLRHLEVTGERSEQVIRLGTVRDKAPLVLVGDMVQIIWEEAPGQMTVLTLVS